MTPAILSLDYHGGGGAARDQMVHVPWRYDMDSPGFVYISLQGMSDVPEGGFWGSNIVDLTVLRLAFFMGY